ncbi:MAG: transposase [Elainellaceae cyanobacterium]
MVNGTMPSAELREQHWQRVVTQLRSMPGVYVGQEANCRCFVEAVLWIDKTGAQWRELLGRYGNWNSVFKRVNRWSPKRRVGTAHAS